MLEYSTQPAALATLAALAARAALATLPTQLHRTTYIVHVSQPKIVRDWSSIELAQIGRGLQNF